MLTEQASSLECSTTDSNLAIDTECTIMLTGNLTSCTSETYVAIEHTPSSTTFTLPLRIWCYNESQIVLSDPVLERVTNWKTGDCGEDRFQQSRIKVMGTFASGDVLSPRVDITEYFVDSLVSSNETVGVIDRVNRIVSGVAEGEADIFISLLPGVSTTIEVIDNYVDVYSVETNIFTSISVQLSSPTYSPMSILSVTAMLESSFGDIGVEGNTAAYVYFTDGALYTIPQSSLTITTTTPATVISLGNGNIQSIGQGPAAVEISWTPTECSMQQPLATDITEFEVTTPVAVELDLDFSEEVLEGNTRGVPGLGLPSTSRLTVSLIYSDGSSRALQPSDYDISSSDSLVLTSDSSSFIIAANRTVNATSGTITVRYSTAEGAVIDEDSTLEIVNALAADIVLLSYPDNVRHPTGTITLERLSFTNIPQQARIYAQVDLSNGSSHSVVPTTFNSDGAGAVSFNTTDGVITGVSNGGTRLTFTIGEFILPTVTIDISGARVEVQSISSLTLEDISYTQKQVMIDLTFDDGTVIRDVLNYLPELLSLVQFSISPPEVATINNNTLILSITDNHYDFVNLMAVTTTSNVLSRSVLFAANLEPAAVGALDIGQQDGIPQPPVSVGNKFTTPIRVNLGENDLGAYHLVTEYNPDEVSVVSATPSLPGLYYINADSTNGIIHTIYLSTYGYEIEESEPTILTFTYSALRNNTVATVTSELRVLIDKSIANIATLDSDSIDVLIGSTSLSRRRRDSPRVRRQTPSTTTDLNGDGSINVADAAYLMRYVAEGTGSVTLAAGDANRDGAITVADVIFLARASAGLIPFLDTLTVNEVSSASNCSLDIQAEVSFSTEEFVTNATSVYFVLSHPQFRNEIGLSNAQVGSQLPYRDDTSVIFKAAASQERGAYRLSLNTPLDSQAENIGISVLVLTEDDNSISPDIDRLAVFTKTRTSTFVSNADLVPALRNVSLDQRTIIFDITDPDGFSPFTIFTNNRRSDYCRFAGSYFNISLLENALVGSTVFTFTAYEPPFPSYMENYTIASATQPGHFMINDSTGMLGLVQRLDFETIPSYTLSIDAYSEQGDYYIGQVTIQINVLDLNDFAPEFINPESYVTDISEDNAPNATIPILTVRARDLDDGINGRFYFSLVDSTGTFNISTVGDTGEIYQIGSLDREQVGSYNLTVYVMDMGTQVSLNSSASVIINVGDVNDNDPVFREAMYMVRIREDIYRGVRVDVSNFSIVADDADEGLNGMIVLMLDPYRIEPGKPFVLSNSGTLSVRARLDRETRSRYNYTVMAADMGSVPRVSFVELIIIIEDVNDNPPVFSQENEMMVTMEEDTPVGTSITTILADDADIGTNMEITYSILTTAPVPFFIDPNSGVLSVSQSLDVNVENEYPLTISASNVRGNPPLSANGSIVIYIIEKQVIRFDVGNSGFLIGEPRRLMEGRRYVQQVGALFSENIGTPVSVSGGINTAFSGELDRAEIPNMGDAATTVRGAVFDTTIRHSLRTVTVFVQAFDSRNVIVRPTPLQVSVTPSPRLRQLGTVDIVTGACITSEDLGFCMVRVTLPDEWFARDLTNPATDTVSVWANIAGQGSQILLADNLLVENSPAYTVDFDANRILLVPPSHDIYPSQNFIVEIYIVSPLDFASTYNRVQADITTANAVASLVDVEYDRKNWNCGESKFAYILAANDIQLCIFLFLSLTMQSYKTTA